MKRRAYAVMVATALMMGVLAIATSLALGYPLRDPEGFLGPAWVRLPMLLIGAFIADVVPRTLWRSRFRVSRFREEASKLLKEHWTRERITLVVVGLVSFYVTYVSYRNLKSFLPFVRTGGITAKGDRMLHRMDEWLMFGHDPAVLLHNLLGTGVTAHLLSYIYLIFLPMVPISVTVWLVWSRNVSFGYWFVTSQCIVWTLGTASYYMIPTLGPNFAYPWFYQGLADTGVSALQDSLYYGRQNILHDPFADGVNSVAGFASLHVGVTLLMALVGQYTLQHRWMKVVLWVYMAVTVLSTTYFGWHYIADDLAGIFIAVVAWYLGAIATGQKFDRRLRHSHPTTTTSSVPVENPLPPEPTPEPSAEAAVINPPRRQ
ncbi:MAG TPA: phosphatase PAP2 family protein [Marmoricola sp.]|nr:phosphatase PAP2 family protein [Marmoricola sp.]